MLKIKLYKKMKKKFTFRYFYGMYFVDHSTRCRLTLKFFFYLKIVDLKSLIHMDGLLFSKMLFCLNY